MWEKTLQKFTIYRWILILLVTHWPFKYSINNLTSSATEIEEKVPPKNWKNMKCSIGTKCYWPLLATETFLLVILHITDGLLMHLLRVYMGTKVPIEFPKIFVGKSFPKLEKTRHPPYQISNHSLIQSTSLLLSRETLSPPTSLSWRPQCNHFSPPTAFCHLSSLFLPLLLLFLLPSFSSPSSIFSLLPSIWSSADVAARR